MSGRVLIPHAIVPSLAVALAVCGWSAQVEAAADDPDEKKQADDRADDDAGNGAAAEGLRVIRVVVVVVVDLDEGYRGGWRGILPSGDGVEGSCWVDGFDSVKSWVYDPFEDEVFEFLTR